MTGARREYATRDIRHLDRAVHFFGDHAAFDRDASPRDVRRRGIPPTVVRPLTERDTTAMLAIWLQIGTQPMPSITIRSISPSLHERLKDIARRHHRSLQNEIIACLERHAQRAPHSKTELMAEAAALRDKLPFCDHALVDRFKRNDRP